MDLNFQPIWTNSPFHPVPSPLQSPHDFVLHLCVSVLTISPPSTGQTLMYVALLKHMIFLISLLFPFSLEKEIFTVCYLDRRHSNKGGKSITLETDCQDSHSTLPLTSHKTSCNFLTSLCLSFHICKMGTIIDCFD